MAAPGAPARQLMFCLAAGAGEGYYFDSVADYEANAVGPAVLLHEMGHNMGLLHAHTSARKGPCSVHASAAARPKRA